MRIWIACILFLIPGARAEPESGCAPGTYVGVRAERTWLDRHSLTRAVRQAFDRYHDGLDERVREECHSLWNLSRVRANGEEVVVGGTRVRVRSMIGVGGEGVVYLAEGPSGPCVLKEFYKGREMAGNLEGMSRLAARGVPVPLTLATDPQGQVLFQYVRGIPVDVLLESPGINRGAQEAIRKKLQELELATGVALPEANVLLDPDTGRFYLIDSR